MTNIKNKMICFNCGFPGHTPLNCKNKYNTDGEYVGFEKICEYCSREFFDYDTLNKHMNICKIYYSKKK